MYSERGEAWAWARTNDSVGLVECVHTNDAPASAFALAPNLQAGIHDTSTAAKQLLELCLRCAPWQLRKKEEASENNQQSCTQTRLGCGETDSAITQKWTYIADK